jgi:hypothetical protein
MQRRMLFRLADHELRVAEAAEVRGLRYRPPDRWSVPELLWSLAVMDPEMDAIISGKQRAEHEQRMQLFRDFQAGKPEAREAYRDLVTATSMSRGRIPPPPFEETDFKPYPPAYEELTGFNSSRTIAALYRRGFVDHFSHCRRYNLALTAAGFAEARRLGGVRWSEIVGLDAVQRNWRKHSDFRLGLSDTEIAILYPRRKNGPPRDVVVIDGVDHEYGFTELVVNRLYPDPP